MPDGLPDVRRQDAVCIITFQREEKLNAISTAVERALLAALDGPGLVVESRAATAVVDALVDDLRHLGPVDHRGAEASPGAVATAPHGTISPQARALLALLAEGLTLGEAAAHLGMSRRTADRRLAEARGALRTERTTEAVARARRLGWFDAHAE